MVPSCGSDVGNVRFRDAHVLRSKELVVSFDRLRRRGMGVDFEFCTAATSDTRSLSTVHFP